MPPITGKTPITMKKNHFPLALIVSCSLLLISFAKANNSSITVAPVKDSVDSITIAEEATLTDKLFNELHLQAAGLSKETVELWLQSILPVNFLLFTVAKESR